MGRQIIKQPNDQYCIWSSIVDDLLLVNATKKDVIDWFAEDAANRVIANVTVTIETLDKGENPYFQFKKEWNEVEEEYNQIMKEIEQ